MYVFITQEKVAKI